MHRNTLQLSSLEDSCIDTPVSTSGSGGSNVTQTFMPAGYPIHLPPLYYLSMQRKHEWRECKVHRSKLPFNSLGKLCIDTPVSTSGSGGFNVTHTFMPAGYPIPLPPLYYLSMQRKHE